MLLLAFSKVEPNSATSVFNLSSSPDVPVERQLNTLVFAPETTAVNTQFRIFVQITSDGLLVGGEPSKLLETSHVHLPNDQVQSLSTSFQTLHPGLYFVDYTATSEGTYVFHIVTFSQGTISHGSAATNVLTQDISGISNQILRLNSILENQLNKFDFAFLIVHQGKYHHQKLNIVLVDFGFLV